MADSTVTAPAPPEPRRRRRARRWALRLLVAVVTLLVVFVVTVQIVINSTTIPRRLVVAQVERATGLRLDVTSVNTGWFGHTTLRDVSVSLPLEQQPFAAVPEMRVEHTWLAGLILTQSIEIRRIEVDRPHVQAARVASGAWNLQQVAEVIARSARPPSP